MNSESVGRVKSGSGKYYEVRWDPKSKIVYVEYAGRTNCGTADNAAHAMRKAEAFLHDK